MYHGHESNMSRFRMFIKSPSQKYQVRVKKKFFAGTWYPLIGIIWCLSQTITPHTTWHRLWEVWAQSLCPILAQYDKG